MRIEKTNSSNEQVRYLNILTGLQAKLIMKNSEKASIMNFTSLPIW